MSNIGLNVLLNLQLRYSKTEITDRVVGWNIAEQIKAFLHKLSYHMFIMWNYSFYPNHWFFYDQKVENDELSSLFISLYSYVMLCLLKKMVSWTSLILRSKFNVQMVCVEELMVLPQKVQVLSIYRYGLFYDRGTRSVSFEVKNDVFQICLILMFLYCR